MIELLNDSMDFIELWVILSYTMKIKLSTYGNPSMGYMATPSMGLPYVWSADTLAQYDDGSTPEPPIAEIRVLAEGYRS